MDIVEKKHLFPNTPVARYNVAAWHAVDEDRVVLIGREVDEAGSSGEPDIGKLVLVEIDTNGEVLHERTIWEPMYDNFYLEDPRALMLEDGSIVIGLTAVLRGKTSIAPFPAVVRIDSHSSWRDVLPPVTLIQTFGPGKNLTPIDRHTFFFRPDDKDFYHKLLVFHFHSLIPKKLQEIQFPTNLPWATWRIGTTMPPIWMNEKEALFIIHGISIIDGKYVYNIGRAKLCRNDEKFALTVSPDPILTPDDFMTEGQALVEELHPSERRVVYSCGGIIKRNKQDTLYLYVNVGDRATFEVGFSMDKLKEGLFDKECD